MKNCPLDFLFASIEVPWVTRGGYPMAFFENLILLAVSDLPLLIGKVARKIPVH